MAPTVAGRPSVRPASGVDSGGGGEGGGGDRYRGSLLCMTEAAAAERPFGPLGGVVRSVGSSVCRCVVSLLDGNLFRREAEKFNLGRDFDL